jgi:RND family efflux transporter MFP subunit
MGKLTTILLGALLLATGCQQSGGGSPKKKSEVLVRTAKATEKDLQGWVETAGKLSPVSSIEVRPRVRGSVDAILAKEGKTVEEDTPLFQIDDRSYQFKLEELKNKLAIEKTRLSYLQKKLERIQGISDPDYISKTDREALDLSIEETNAAIAETDIKLQAAQLDCEFCLIRAPISGRLGKINAHVGQWVSEGDKPLTTIDKVDHLVVEFSLAEDDLQKLEARPIPFTVVSLAQHQVFCSSHCTFIDHQVDSKTGLIRIEGVVPNNTKKFRKNQIVKVLIEGRKFNNVVTIPRRAVKMNEEGAYVYKINGDNEAELHPVLLGEELDDLAIVQVGVDAGDEIVTEGHLRLYPGAKIIRKNDTL